MAGTHKHSLSAPSFRMPATAPNSPANANSNRYVYGSPVTPQRVTTKSNNLAQNQNQNYQGQQQHEYPKQTQSACQPRINRRVLQSPSTPLSNVSSSPYTPLSFRSYASSNVTTPGSAYSNNKKLNLAVMRDADSESLADIAMNWRNRANENGIKVGNSEGEGDADDERSDPRDSPSATGIINETQSENPLGPNYVPEDSLLPAPFLSNHRRPRARSHTQSLSYPNNFTSTNNSTDAKFLTPQPSKTHSQSFEHNAMYHELEFDQSFDQSFTSSPVKSTNTQTPVRRPLLPAPHTLRPENLYTPPAKKSNSSYLAKGSFTDPVKPRRRPQPPTELFDISEDFVAGLEGDISYPDSFFGQEMGLGLGLRDPFEPTYPYGRPLGRIEESDGAAGMWEIPYPDSESPYSLPAPLPASALPTPASPEEMNGGCSVCGRLTGSRAILKPCEHPLCSACLTSALNIVGEKDMECSVCRGRVGDFVLVSGDTPSPTSEGEREAKEERKEFFENVQARSSPPPPTRSNKAKQGSSTILRIDNVPWDITPPLIRAFFSHSASITAVHVLLDSRGKTQSHAFVEFDDPEEAKSALRGAQKNSVMGEGRRKRGVTVTRAGDEELMMALFPSWRGSFEGGKPSLAGVPHGAIGNALKTGLITEGELASLRKLIESPDSRFLKVPSLPYWSLVGLLGRWPKDVDSRVFWGGGVRDCLAEVVEVALGKLVATDATEGEEKELVEKIFEAAVACQAFTTQQIRRLTELVDNTPYSYGSGPSPPSSPIPQLRTPPEQIQIQNKPQIRQPTMNMNMGMGTTQPFGALAREFGVEPGLVEALAQRLAAAY